MLFIKHDLDNNWLKSNRYVLCFLYVVLLFAVNRNCVHGIVYPAPAWICLEESGIYHYHVSTGFGTAGAILYEEEPNTMFRKMSRYKQELSKEECLKILTEEPRGVLSVIGDDGYPYGMPMNYWYCPDDGKIYFHGGKHGHKIDALKNCPKASFCVYDQGFREEGEWFLRIKSVIIFGQIEFIENLDRIIEVSRELSLKYTRDESYIESEIQKFGKGTLCFALNIEHMTGKIVKES